MDWVLVHSTLLVVEGKQFKVLAEDFKIRHDHPCSIGNVILRRLITKWLKFFLLLIACNNGFPAIEISITYLILMTSFCSSLFALFPLFVHLFGLVLNFLEDLTSIASTCRQMLIVLEKNSTKVYKADGSGLSLAATSFISQYPPLPPKIYSLILPL